MVDIFLSLFIENSTLMMLQGYVVKYHGYFPFRETECDREMFLRKIRNRDNLMIRVWKYEVIFIWELE